MARSYRYWVRYYLECAVLSSVNSYFSVHAGLKAADPELVLLNLHPPSQFCER